MIFTTSSSFLDKELREEAQERTSWVDTFQKVSEVPWARIMLGSLLLMDLSSCPVKVTADVISGKWKPLIIFSLKPGPLRYSELRKHMPGPTHKVLTQQLRQLERDRIISRKVYPHVPPKVEYSLTAYGRTLTPILGSMAKWGEKHAARKR
jgi:DNA-binding HxlR family transcriptional regulator